jgi:hypothetical protein
MTEFERINQPRVEKIHKMIDVIEKSAKSNKVDHMPILSCVADRLKGSEEIPTPEPDKDRQQTSAKPINSQLAFMDAVRTLPLQYLVDAMHVIVARIDEELYGRRK